MTQSQQEFTLEPYEKIGGVLEKVYKSQWRPSFNYDDNKPVLARRIVPNITELLDQIDLKPRIRELVEAIRAAN